MSTKEKKYMMPGMARISLYDSFSYMAGMSSAGGSKKTRLVDMRTEDEPKSSLIAMQTG
jgi:hypothetical protein